MADFLTFLPLAQETIDSIRARIDNDANAGIDPSSDDWIDLTEGGFFFDLTQALALEIHRLWDFASAEVPAVAFPAFAWGEYLDEHGESIGLSRKAASKATGTVTFTGTDTTLVATGTEVAVTATGDDEDAVTFVTTTDGTISGGSVDIPVEAVDAGSAGNVLASTINILISPNSGVASVSNAAALSGGTDVEVDEDYRERILLELGAAQGAGTISDYERWSLAYEGIGRVTVVPLWDGAGTVRVVVIDAEQNPVSSATKHGLQDLLDPPEFLATTTNSESISGGASTIEVDSTTGFAASGTFIISDIILNQSQEVTYTGVTATTFTGCTGAVNTYSAGARISQGFGQGRGLAPIGAIVTVDTAATVTVDVDAVVTHDDGYSLDGGGGTIATEDDLITEIRGYIDELEPGEDVVLNHVISRFFRVRGIEDVSGVELNAAAANVTIDDDEVAQTDTITLT